MKGKNKSLIWMLPALLVLVLNLPANAQDDLYYDPSTDTKPVRTYEQTYEEPNNVTPRTNGGDDQYYEEDDYAYEYSSRIRRFHQPAVAADYYDPFFIDLYHYDPYYLPGASIYTYGYNDYWAMRRWQTWNAWNPWNPWNPYAGYGYGLGMGYNSWTGWNVSFGWGAANPWYNPYVWNRYYYDPYWTWNGYNPYYNSCAADYGYYYYNNHNNYYPPPNGGNNGHHPQTYVGPRRGGTSVNTGGTGGSGRYTQLTSGTMQDGRLLVVDKEAPVIEIKSRPNSRDVVEKQRAMAEQQVDRAVPSTSRKPTTTGKDPAAISSGGKDEAARPATETRPTREAIPGSETTPSRRPTQPTETRPSRQPSQETRPSRSEEPLRNIETRPSRSSGGSNEATRPSRPSSEDRPVRSTETRPSRSSGDGGSSKSWDSAPSNRSSGSSNSGSSGSGSRSGGGSSSGGSSKSSGGGGSRGRN